MDIDHILSVLNKTISSIDVHADEAMMVWAPMVVYWVQCTLFEILMWVKIPFFEKYRIHSNEELQKKNKVSFGKVIVMVAFQHIIQTIVGIILMKNLDIDAELRNEITVNRYTAVITSYLRHIIQSKETCVNIAGILAKGMNSYIIPAIQFVAAMFVVDTQQYVLHRIAHSNKFLYKHLHSHHHRLTVTYAFGALYNHPVEGFLLDSCGAAIAFELTGMSARLGMYFFVFSTLKTINDHCGYSFPWDPLNILFKNNVNFHDIHHQPYGIKTNFSQPFFTFWDDLLHTEYTQVIKAKAEAKSRVD